MTLIIQHLRFLLTRLEIQSSAFSAGLGGADLAILLLESAKLFPEML